MEEVEETVELHLILDLLHPGNDAIIAGAPLLLEIARVRGHDAGLAADDEALQDFGFLDLKCDSESVCLAGEEVLYFALHNWEVAEEGVAAAEDQAGMVAHFVFSVVVMVVWGGDRIGGGSDGGGTIVCKCVDDGRRCRGVCSPIGDC